MSDIHTCRHSDTESIEEHYCPYAQEINDDDTPCRCCDDCEYQCAQDI